MNQLSCMIATAMNQNEGWHKTGNIAQMYSALKCEEKIAKSNCGSTVWQTIHSSPFIKLKTSLMKEDSRKINYQCLFLCPF